MKFKTYQDVVRPFASYPQIGHNPYYLTLGLCGESGEVAEKIKKIMRDHDGDFSQDATDEIIKELGDVLWYIQQLSWELGYTLEDVAAVNMIKLSSRADRGKLHGNGDNR